MTKFQTKPVLILIKCMVGHTTQNEPPLWKFFVFPHFLRWDLWIVSVDCSKTLYSKSNWHIKLCTSDIVCLKINLFPLSYAASVTCVFVNNNHVKTWLIIVVFAYFFLYYHWQLEENTAQMSFNSLQKKCLSIINCQELEEIWKHLALTARQL